MAKPTTKLNAQDRVMLFCAAIGIDTGDLNSIDPMFIPRGCLPTL
jgi:hypothetical protein